MAVIRQSYEILPDFSAAGDASQSVKRLLKQLDVPADIIRRAAIAMYEGEINAVIHAGGGRADVEIEDNALKIVLSDKGPGIADVNAAMCEGFSTAGENARNLGFGAGMGLPNMKKNADELSIDTKVGEGTVVNMLIKL